ncbi:MAG: hypothetical protein RBR41_07835 [Desulfovibrio sp.]|uniref:hypothetical protein n=1 Tax=Desulfovibrio sp. TaxID=885 RepID=UPI002A368D8D|nr:hypothetical protein [Desulfovibrio sp.]MDY0259564.1 hypothetical protein [Desulfovibrio sp.]
MAGVLTPPAPLRVPQAAAGLIRHRHARLDSHMGGRMDSRMDGRMVFTRLANQASELQGSLSAGQSPSTA